MGEITFAVLSQFVNVRLTRGVAYAKTVFKVDVRYSGSIMVLLKYSLVKMMFQKHTWSQT